MLKFPVDVRKIETFLPHRGPAIWIDEVLSVTDKEGQCKIKFQDTALYATDGMVRPSSYIEWIGQAYGYFMSCQATLAGLGSTRLKRAYLVGVRDIEILRPKHSFKNGDEIIVQVKKTHEMGPLILIQGIVQAGEDQILARGQVKIFAEG